MTDKNKFRSKAAKWTRRGFLATAGVLGGGLALGLAVSPNRLEMTGAAQADTATTLNTWVKISPDNRVTMIFPHSEMGQGAGTGLAQMLAEEMEADWNLVAIEQAPAEDAYINSDLGRGYVLGDAYIPGFAQRMIDYTFLQLADGLVGQMTGGSTAIRLTGHYGMRRAGAAAREMLMQAAAEEWGVDAATLTVENSVISHAASSRSATFGELATKAATFTPNLQPDMKDPKDYKIVGLPKPRLDLPAKVDGTAEFGIDVTVPGMVYAAIALPAIKDATATATGPAPDIAGVDQVVNLGDAVLVSANSYWVAQRALDALDITWEGGQTALSSEMIRATQTSDLDTKDRDSMESAGDTDAALGGESRAAEFYVPFLAHATMEPMNCTASVTSDGCEVWVGHQNMLFARNAAAKVLGIAPEKVTMHPTYLGGGFGRRSELDFVKLSVRAAEALGKPVKVIWSRATDLANDTYRPAITARLEGAVKDGKITALRNHYIHTETGMPDSEGPFALQYDVPNKDIARVHCPAPIPVGTWRSVDFSQMGFFYESFMDELAEAAGEDPLAFRLAHLSDPRRRAVLERLATEADWGKSLPEGRAQGIAMVHSFHSTVAQCIELSVSDNVIKLHKATSVVDCGRVINPDAAEAQVIGSVIFGLSSAMSEEITLDQGRVQQENYPDYEVLKLANTPDQSVHFMSHDAPPGGLGEPALPPVAPALANALYRATGTRVRELPLSRAGFYSA
ncbi:isoquinoline 1-oxidoreductase beta subunit [Litoreibacter ponti]|uniref:Isoquinoline 1-oxidoreductase beta subunit n=1 Tax=Litoreibacter ponti TaxID=1510457 RepID=A0A2T6BLB2_9RHOB|nr:molybdopterin cofactor-binding domain-containing protein [Litoreibacter ponti]PTX56863.1 isoquinoline 1-oxidoreductase beta subunit [Litoreibacter ponti]